VAGLAKHSLGDRSLRQRFVRRTLSALKYRVAGSISPKLYWTLMGRFQTVAAVTSACSTLQESLDSGRDVVAMFQRLMLLHPDAITLQIGCGIGRIEYHLCQHVKRCYGVDISPSMIKKARAIVRAPNVEFCCTDGRGLADFDGTFDLVYSIFAFQHMARPVVQKYFRDSFAKLVDGGRFAFQLMVDDSPSRPEPPPSHPYGLRYYTRAEVRRMLTSVGFEEPRIFDFDTSEPDDNVKVGDLLFVATKPAES
jgi:SAM-dependent methyltransferase